MSAACSSARPRADPVEHRHRVGLRALRERRLVHAERVLRHRMPAAPAEHHDVEQGVRPETVGAVHRHARALAGGEHPGHRRLLRPHDDLALDVRRDAAHRVVRGRLGRHGLGGRLHAQVDPRELRDVGDLLLDDLAGQVADVDVHVVLAVDAAAFLDLLVDRAAHHVPRREVLDGRRVPLHEALAVAVQQDAALAPHGLGDEDAQLVDPGRVELVHLHVLEGDPSPERHRRAVAGQRVGVRRDLEDPPVAAGGEQDRLRLEHVQFAGGQLVGDDAGAPTVLHQQVQHVELVEEPDVALDALLVERLQDHVARAVGREAGPADRTLTVVARVPPEPPLVDPALGSPVEGESPVLELDDPVDRLVAHDLGGRLVDQVVAALDRVERVPLGVVLLDVPEGRAHPALRRAGVRAGRVQLGDHRDVDVAGGLDRGAEPGPAGPDDHG